MIWIKYLYYGSRTRLFTLSFQLQLCCSVSIYSTLAWSWDGLVLFVLGECLSPSEDVDIWDWYSVSTLALFLCYMRGYLARYVKLCFLCFFVVAIFERIIRILSAVILFSWISLNLISAHQPNCNSIFEICWQNYWTLTYKKTRWKKTTKNYNIARSHKAGRSRSNRVVEV